MKHEVYGTWESGRQLYLLHLRWEFVVTCQISPREVQAEDFVSKFQELTINHI
jgi:hypothetical protein